MPVVHGIDLVNEPDDFILVELVVQLALDGLPIGFRGRRRIDRSSDDDGQERQPSKSSFNEELLCAMDGEENNTRMSTS
jgi:hypothetical protein